MGSGGELAPEFSPTPPSETARLAALERYSPHCTPPDEALGRSVSLAARVLSAPIALVSLVGESRVWFPAAHGLEIREIPSNGSFCAHAILQDGVTIVEDAAADPRFRENPLVREFPHTHFYAAAPLLTPDGFRLGALAILDTVPRPPLSGDLRKVLAELAADIMEELERRRSAPAGTLPFSREIRILDALPVGAWLADRTGRIVHANPAGRRIWGGFRPVTSDGYDEYVAWWPETGERVRPEQWSLACAIATGQITMEQAVSIQTFDGNQKIILDSGAPLCGPSGELLGAVAVNQDITAQRRAQDALHRLTEELRCIIDASPLALISLARDHTVLSWSPAAEQIFGWKAEEVVGHPYPVVPQGYEEQYHRHYTLVFRGETIRELETYRRRKDGCLINVRISAAPLHSPSGEITGAVLLVADITEKKKAECALKESEERYRNLVEHSPFGIAVHCDRRIAYLNPAVLRIFGDRPAEDFLGRDPAQFVEPSSRAAYHAMIENVLGTGRGARATEIGLQRADGAVAQVEITALPFSYEGRPAVLVILRDITERKRTEKKLRRHQRDRTALVDVLPGVVVMKDRESKIITANRRFCQLYNCSPEDVIGKTEFDFVPHDEAGRQRLYDEQVMATGETLYREDKIWSPTRGEVEVGIVLAPLTEEDGTPRGVISVGFELTEKRAIEAALRQSEERFRRAVLEAPIPIIIHARDGRILQINKAWLEQSGYSAEELRTMDDWIAKARGGDPGSRALIEGLFQMESGSISREISVRTGDGRERTWSISSSPLGPLPDGTAVMIAMAMDITERRSLEQQLAQSQKMEAIGQLAGGVAHDFNNLLTVISGYSNLLLESLSDPDPACSQVKEIARAAERATSLTRQLLAFSRKQILRPANVDINTVIHESERMLRRLIGEDIEIRLSLANAEMRVLVDTGQLTQVIMNLAVNARDAMPHGGVLTIETSPAESDDEIPGPYVRIEISDTGAGMDAATRERIFEPFFTTKAPGSGTGLGLSTVYGIVKQSNGHIRVSSEPGNGTSFRIYLPRVFERPEPAPLRPAALPAGGGETILLVEDEPALRKLAREILRRAGYRVIDTANGDEAIRACREAPTPIALLITDLVLPGMSGRELAQRLAILRPELRVLFMSGYSGHAALAAGILDGSAPFLQKPFSPAALAEKVRLILS